MSTNNLNDEHRYIVRSKLTGKPIPNCSVGEYLQQQIKQTDPERVAIIDVNSGRQLTYGQLEQNAHHIASSMVELGIEASDNSLFYAENRFQYASIYLSLNYLGLTACPIPPASGRYEIGQQLAGIEGEILIISANKLTVIRQMLSDDNNSTGGPILATLKMLIIMDEENLKNLDELKEISKHPNSPKRVMTLAELERMGTGKRLKSVPYFPKENPETDPYLIVFTSGSTGLPKGAVHSHRSFVASLINLGFYRFFESNTTVASLYPFGHISGTIFFAALLSQRCTTVFFTELTIERYLEAIERYRIENLSIYPAQLLNLYQNLDQYQRNYDLSSVKVLFFCSTKFPKTQIEFVGQKLNVVLEEMYASSELCPNVANVETDLLTEYRYGQLGKPLPNIELMIVDTETGKSLPANQQGEICFRGPNRFMRYLNSPEITAKTIDAEGWYHTGDVGYYDEQDNLFMTDRIKELVKFQYWSVSPFEVEIFLESHPAVHDVCVVPVRHQSEGSHLRAYVKLVEGSTTSEQDLVNYVKENMSYAKRLFGGVRFVQSIPRTQLGKIERTYFKNLVKDELITELAEPED